MMLSKWDARIVVTKTRYGFSALLATPNTIAKNQPLCPANSIYFTTDISAANHQGSPITYWSHAQYTFAPILLECSTVPYAHSITIPPPIATRRRLISSIATRHPMYVHNGSPYTTT